MTEENKRRLQALSDGIGTEKRQAAEQQRRALDFEVRFQTWAAQTLTPALNGVISEANKTERLRLDSDPHFSKKASTPSFEWEIRPRPRPHEPRPSGPIHRVTIESDPTTEAITFRTGSWRSEPRLMEELNARAIEDIAVDILMRLHSRTPEGRG